MEYTEESLNGLYYQMLDAEKRRTLEREIGEPVAIICLHSRNVAGNFGLLDC